MEHAVRPARWLGGAVVALAAVFLIASCSAREHPAASSTVGAVAPSAALGGHSGHSGHSGPFTPPPAAPLRASERFVTLKLPEPYTPKAPSGGTDEYRCFLVDPGLTSRAFLTGSQFLPQNTAIVHHAIIFRVGPEDAKAAGDLDARTPGEGWTCFGDAGIDGGTWVGHWAPGANETLLTQKVGYPMPAGSRLIFQVHYNLLATGGKPGGSDQSGIRLRLTDGKTDLAPLVTAQLPAPIELPCTAEESGALCDREAAIRDLSHRFGEQAAQTVKQLNGLCDQGKTPVPSATHHCDLPAKGGGTIYAVAGHMHLLGRSIKLELNPGTPEARTLLDIPEYNFDDQAIHPLAKPVVVKAGDTFRVTCTYDAGLRKLLPALHGLPPRYVVWGEGTSDEMCLGLAVMSPATAPAA
ncbi:monooxygenase [Planotetraspora sp. A-T 1434]|uniref:monooxygenase n=1 Tax=Planotetraspora sp. A-T 1434 TaxID=2979219 RepID=UPI0021C23846|nr:monooxygenase [Planotetraspora sp. A-T 1434]MCT9933413.1 monooxygenase [Planotetraspora sp. A-T 1434]